MPLEAGDGFISGLVVTNPVNATDQVSQGDDHLRLIKTAVKGTFPNLTGAVTATQAQLNVLATDGAGAGIVADLGAIADPGADRIFGWDESANAAIAYALSTGLTTSTTNLLIDTTVVPRLGVQNTFTANQTFSGGSLQIGVHDGAREVRLRSAGEVGTASNDSFSIITFDTAQLTINGSGNFDFKDGTVTTDNLSASEVGYKGTPQNVQDGNYGIVLTDCGKTIYKSAGGAGETITIPANGTIAIPVGTIIRVVNNGGGDLGIAITTDTLSLAGVGTTGSRVLADHGVAVLEKVASQEWFISGVGVS